MPGLDLSMHQAVCNNPPLKHSYNLPPPPQPPPRPVHLAPPPPPTHRFNTLVFGGRLPSALPLVWNPRLRSTAGQLVGGSVSGNKDR